VAVEALEHSVKRLKRSSPTCFSSNEPQVPMTSGVKPFTDVWMVAPVALQTRTMSPTSTLPAQNRPLSAKYCVARSPMGSLESTTLAPLAMHLSSLS